MYWSHLPQIMAVSRHLSQQRNVSSPRFSSFLWPPHWQIIFPPCSFFFVLAANLFLLDLPKSLFERQPVLAPLLRRIAPVGNRLLDFLVADPVLLHVSGSVEMGRKDETDGFATESVKRRLAVAMDFDLFPVLGFADGLLERFGEFIGINRVTGRLVDLVEKDPLRVLLHPLVVDPGHGASDEKVAMVPPDLVSDFVFFD